jgi:hypothetical protein
MLMGMLKKKGKSDGLDIGGLVGMLIGQKDNISKAMPAGLGDSLSGMGLLDDGSEKVTDTAASAAAAGKEAADSGKSLLSKLLPIIVLAILAWLAYQFLMKPDTNPTADSATVGAVQAVDQLESLMNEAGNVLAGIDSVESASRALSSLQGVDQGLGKLVEAAANMPSAQGAKLAQRFEQLAPQLESSLAKAYAVPGARDVLSGTVDSMLSKLQRISGS